MSFRWSFFSRSCARPSTIVPDPATCDIDPDRAHWRGVPAIDNRCTLAVSNPTLSDAGMNVLPVGSGKGISGKSARRKMALKKSKIGS